MYNGTEGIVRSYVAKSGDSLIPRWEVTMDLDGTVRSFIEEKLTIVKHQDALK